MSIVDSAAAVAAVDIQHSRYLSYSGHLKVHWKGKLNTTNLTDKCTHHSSTGMLIDQLVHSHD